MTHMWYSVGMKKTATYHLIFTSEPEGGYTVVVPSLPGVVTYGKTLEDAKEMAVDAIRGYLVVLKKHKQPIPSDRDSFITQADFVYA